MYPYIGHGVSPLCRLEIELIQVTKHHGPKTLPNVSNGALDLTLGPAAIGLASSWNKAVVLGKIQISRVPFHTPLTVIVKHQRRAIVTENLAWNTSKKLQRMTKGTKNMQLISGFDKLKVQHAGVRKHHGKAPYLASFAFKVQVGESPQIDLG